MTQAKTTSKPIERRSENGTGDRSAVAREGATVITLRNVVSAREALIGICSMKLKDYDLMLKLHRSRRELEPLFEDYDAERKKLIDEHALKNDNGDPLTTEQGNVRFKNSLAFERELTQLQKTNVQVETTFEFADFRDLVEKLGMPGEYLVALGDLVS